MSKNIDFHIEEYRALRCELIEQIKEAYSTEKYAAAGAFATTAWLLTTGLPVAGSHMMIAWFIPFTIVLAGFFRSIGLLLRIRTIADHLKMIELRVTKDGYEAMLR